MTSETSFLKDTPAKIMFVIFLANIFYDDPTLYLYKRVGYSICIYYAIWEIGKFYYQVKLNEDSYKMPLFYNLYVPLLAVFLVITLGMDLMNPNLNLITLLNNPFGLLSIGPIFLFVVGTNTSSIVPLYKFLIFTLFIFLITVLLPFLGKVKYYQGYICSYSFIPVFFISLTIKKYQKITWLLLLVGLYFSQMSDYRIIALRILAFVGLWIGFNMFKKYGVMKFLIIVVCCAGLYLFIMNLEDVLYLFKGIIGVKSFDDDDTRAFLWTEVLGDLHGIQYIFGKGFLGTYFSEYFLMILIHYRTYGDHYERFSVEVGFLQLVLKGGFFWYILFVTPIVYSSIKGIFWHYRDGLVLAISVFLFTELMLMFIENIPYFSFQYSMIFFLSGYALRRMRYGDESLEFGEEHKRMNEFDSPVLTDIQQRS